MDTEALLQPWVASQLLRSWRCFVAARCKAGHISTQCSKILAHMQRTARLQSTLRPFVEAQRASQNLNSFITLRNEDELSKAYNASTHSGGSLQGSLIAVKDNICTSELPTTCGSKALEGFKSPYEASAVAAIRNAGGIIVGKTNLDEFGMGSNSFFSAFGPVKNVCPAYSAGGSSGGSAVAVASGQCQAALGTDTGGSVRLPAAYNGIYGFKPSYGLVSRWGVVSYANSLDTVGVMAKSIQELRKLFNVIDSFDAKDPTSMATDMREKLATLVTRRGHKSQLRIGVPEEYNVDELAPIVRSAWFTTLHSLQKQGHHVQSISLPSTMQALSAYYILAPAEASSNLGKYDGVRYGVQAPDTDGISQQLFSRSRQYGLGEEVRRRILLGAYSLSADAIDNYFIQAQKIRRLVQKDFDNVFSLPNVLTAGNKTPGDSNETVDAIICPTHVSGIPTLEQVTGQNHLNAYAGDVFTAPPSLAGLPALSVPVRPEPDSQESTAQVNAVGIQIIGQYGDDKLVLEIGGKLTKS